MAIIPIELANARAERSRAWTEYLQLTDREHTSAEFEKAYSYAVKCEEVVTEWYNRWQAVGGTSDIVSIVDTEAMIAFANEQSDPLVTFGSPEWFESLPEVEV